MNFVEEILKKPTARLLIEEAVRLLNEETQKRSAFRNWVDESIKAEFINGEVILHSPAKNKHLSICDLLSRILSVYASHKQLGVVRVEKAMVALTRNDYEPDICFFSNDKAQHFTPDQLLFPAPDLVVEILSKKTAKRDRGIKFEDYAAHGVTEYWIIDPDKEIVEQYALIGDLKEYFPIATAYAEDELSSRVVAGFDIPVAAIFEVAVNVETIRKLLML
jgi:Uma2 family endonuclease